MSHNDPTHRSDDRAERPRQEPEILPPEQPDRPQPDLSATFVRIEEQNGFQRIYVAQPGPFTIFAALAILALIAAIVFILFAGFVLVWLPILLAVLAVALAVGMVRYNWERLKAWLAR